MHSGYRFSVSPLFVLLLAHLAACQVNVTPQANQAGSGGDQNTSGNGGSAGDSAGSGGNDAGSGGTTAGEAGSSGSGGSDGGAGGDAGMGGTDAGAGQSGEGGQAGTAQGGTSGAAGEAGVAGTAGDGGASGDAGTTGGGGEGGTAGEAGAGGASGSAGSAGQGGQAAVIWKEVSLGDTSSCALDANGAPWCWGGNHLDRLGNLSWTDQLSPARVRDFSGWSSIQTFLQATYAVDDTHRLLWRSEADPFLEPEASYHPVGDKTDWVEVKKGSMFCARRADGTVYYLPDPGDGQEPSPLPIPPSEKITAAMHSCCGINADGELHCAPHPGWGKDYDDPIDTDWASLAGGWGHLCAIKMNGSLWCWGENALGQLGSGGFEKHTAPNPVLPGVKWKFLSVDAHSCATQENGTLWCWGYNKQGQLGQGDTDNRNLPAQVGTDSDWERVFTGSDDTCALKQDGSLWCWGANAQGQLGDGTRDARLTPTLIKPGPGLRYDLNNALANGQDSFPNKLFKLGIAQAPGEAIASTCNIDNSCSVFTQDGSYRVDLYPLDAPAVNVLEFVAPEDGEYSAEGSFFTLLNPNISWALSGTIYTGNPPVPQSTFKIGTPQKTTSFSQPTVALKAGEVIRVEMAMSKGMAFSFDLVTVTMSLIKTK